MKNCVFQQLKAGSKSEKKKFDFTHVNFKESDLAESIFSFCDLREANFQKSNLENVIFERCDLKHSKLTSANITGANFSDSNIEGTILDIEGFISFGNSKGFILKQLTSESSE